MYILFTFLSIVALGLIAVSGHPWPYRRDVFLALESERADFMGLPFEQYRNKREDPSKDATVTYNIGSNFRENPELTDVPSLIRQYQSQVLENSPDGYQSTMKAARSNTPRMDRGQNNEDTSAQPRFLIPIFESTADVGDFAPSPRSRRQQQTDSMSSTRNKVLPMKKRGSINSFKNVEESNKNDRDDLQFQYYPSDVSRMDRAAEELEAAMSLTDALPPEHFQTRIHRQQPPYVTPVDFKQVQLRPSSYHHYNDYHHYNSEEQDHCPYVNSMYRHKQNTLHQPLHRQYYFPYSDSEELHTPVRYFRTKYPNAFNTHEQHCSNHEIKLKSRKKTKPKIKPLYPKRIEPEPIPESIIVPVIPEVDVVESEHHMPCEKSYKPEVDITVVHSSREAKILEVDEDDASKSLAIIEDSENLASVANVEDSGIEEGSYIQDIQEEEEKVSGKDDNPMPSNRESRKMKLDALQNEILLEVSSEREVESMSKGLKDDKSSLESSHTEEVVSSAEEAAEHPEEDVVVSAEDEAIAQDEKEPQSAPHEEEEHEASSEAAEEEEPDEDRVQVSTDNEETAESECAEDEVTATTSATGASSSVGEEADE